MKALSDLLLTLKKSIDEDSFVKLILSKPKSKSLNIKKIEIQLIHRNGHQNLKFIASEPTKDLTSLHTIDEGLNLIQNELQDSFFNANFWDTQNQFHFQSNKKSNARLLISVSEFKEKPTRSHDHRKKSLITDRTFLQALGIIDDKETIKKGKGKKLKQIEKFLEIIDVHIRQQPGIIDKEEIEVYDMGSGKAYLTFALYDYLTQKLSKKTMVTGIEIRQDLVDLCNNLSSELSTDGLNFKQGSIQEFKPYRSDILMALHACNTATDDAILTGIKSNASLIICSPCCHKQVRKSMDDDGDLQSIKQFGILKERQAELATDAIRALLLEAHGYQTKVFEFVTSEHSGKNLMITAVKHHREIQSEKIYQEIALIKKTLGIGKHHLEELLKTAG